MQRDHRAHLNGEDVDSFFRIWYPLLQSINMRHKVLPPSTSLVSEGRADKSAFVKVRDHLWNGKGLIDEFIGGDGEGMSDEDKDVLRSWRDRVTGGVFTAMRHLRDHTVLMAERNGKIKLYGVTGITNPLRDVMRGIPMPCSVITNLLPFKGKVIYDSFIEPVHRSLDRERMIRNYSNALKADGIITSFEEGHQ